MYTYNFLISWRIEYLYGVFIWNWQVKSVDFPVKQTYKKQVIFRYLHKNIKVVCDGVFEAFRAFS